MPKDGGDNELEVEKFKGFPRSVSVCESAERIVPKRRINFIAEHYSRPIERHKGYGDCSRLLHH